MNQERILTVLMGPHLSEKAANIAESNNQVTFRVALNATKAEVRAAVENLFNVQVRSVQLLNVKGKTKRTARGKLRRRNDWKKAYVRLEQGQHIDFADMA
jgi:large subunit ribosomal protein L23